MWSNRKCGNTVLSGGFIFYPKKRKPQNEKLNKCLSGKPNWIVPCRNMLSAGS